MDENKIIEEEDDEIDLLELFNIVVHHLLLFIIICVVCCSAAFAITEFVMEEKFTAEAKLIVVQQDGSTSSNSSVTYSDIQLSQKLVNTYNEIIMSEAISDTVISNLNLDNKYDIDTEAYGEIVEVSSANSTEVINIDVTTNDAKLSANIANEITNVFESKIYDIMQIQNVTTLSSAKVPEKKSGPSTVKGCLIGAAIGIAICCVITIVLYFKDTKVKTEEEIKKIFDYPIIGTIPEFEVNEKETSDYVE